MSQGWEEKNIIQSMRQVQPEFRPARMSPQEDSVVGVHSEPIEDYENIPVNTLDDGVCMTLGRQFKEMMYKFSYVLCPRSEKGTRRLRNWDLWGPFLMTLIFGLFIDNSVQFVLLFVSVFGGSLIVTFNTRILGGRISFFQSVAILGYCIFPLFIIIFLFKLLGLSIGFRLIGVVIACIWGVLSSKSFISYNISDDKKFVSLYPIALFYLFLGLLVIYM